MDILSLGSSSAGNCHILNDEGHRLILDLGMKWGQIQKGAGFSLSSSPALVTHEHGDHCEAVQDAMGKAVDVYMSPGTIEYLGLSGHRIHPVSAGEEFRVGPWMVYPFRTIHDAEDPLGFVVRTPSGNRVLYATDTCYLPRPFTGITHLMIEANHDEASIMDSLINGDLEAWRKKRIEHNHMSLSRLLIALDGLDLRQVCEIRLLHMSSENANQPLIEQKVRQATGKPVIVPH